ncbi:MAG TPA: alpha/beta fold hydrolase [Ktedonobacterales bacterium]
MSEPAPLTAATSAPTDQPAALRAAEEALLRTAGVVVERGEAPGPAGERLHYLTCGEGEPLVLLHGRGSAAALFTPIFAPLAAQRRVIALDLPGWGLSEKPIFTGRTPQDALRFWMDGVLALLDHLGLDRVDLLGHSMGGFTALGLALEHPDRVRSLLLADAGGLGRTLALDVRLYFWLKPERLHRWLGRNFMARVLAQDGAKRGVPRDEAFEFTWQVTTQQAIIPSGARAFDRWIDLFGVHLNFLDRLLKLEQPTLLLWGERDRVAPYADALRARKLIRHGRLVVFTSCGHSPFTERPADFARVVNVWLNGGNAPSRV